MSKGTTHKSIFIYEYNQLRFLHVRFFRLAFLALRSLVSPVPSWLMALAGDILADFPRSVLNRLASVSHVESVSADDPCAIRRFESSA
jgi:hypothetical protein